MATDAEIILSLRRALYDCTDELESELIARYGGNVDHPAMKRRFDRDMASVRAARALLHSLEPKLAQR